MEQQVKLSKFEKAVFAEVDAKVEEIRREAESAKEAVLRESKLETQRRVDQTIQQQTREIRRQAKREAAKYGLDAKRHVLIRRGEIIDQIFEAVSKKLLAFHDSPEYEDYLLARVTAFGKEHSLPEVQLLLTPADLPLAEKVKKAYGRSCQVLDSPLVRMGGFVVRDAADSIYFDESLGQKLEDQKSYFIEHSQLDL